MFRLIVLIIVLSSLFSQDSLYIKKSIKRLSSKEFYGRGYRFNGHNKAADYIRDELKKHSLKPYHKEYFQDFNLTSNIHVTDAEFYTPTIKFDLGIDFIPYYSSSSSNIFQQKVKVIDEEKLDYFKNLPELSSKVILIKEKLLNNSISLIKRIHFYSEQNVKAIIVVTKDMSYGASYGNFNIPVIKVTKESSERIKNQFISLKMNIEESLIKTQNILAFIPGINKDSTIIFMAHYDHLNALTKDVYFPGANDNASGVSLLLELSKFLKNKTVIHNILFIFFSGEELGLLGSRHFIRNEKISNLNLKFIINLDMVASSEKGIMILGAEEYKNDYKVFEEIAKERNLSKLYKRKNSAISDHYFFLEKGIKGFYIYGLGGKQPYHHINDRAETLQLNKLLEIRTLVLEYTKYQKIWENVDE